MRERERPLSFPSPLSLSYSPYSLILSLSRTLPYSRRLLPINSSGHSLTPRQQRQSFNLPLFLSSSIVHSLLLTLLVCDLSVVKDCVPITLVQGLANVSVSV